MFADRSEQILHALVQTYIRLGEPVGSKTLVAEARMQWSAATVRAVLADLEEQGLIASPHTSAGRVPTVKGYRFFVDTLFRARQPRDWEDSTWQAQLQEHLGGADDVPVDTDILIARTSHLLAEITRCAVLVAYPRTEQVILRHIEFLPLSENRILVVLVMNDHTVENRIFLTEKTYERSQLERASQYLNERFSGCDLRAVRLDLLQALSEDASALQGALAVVQQGLHWARECTEKNADSAAVLIAGQGHLLTWAHAEDWAAVSGLYEAFSEKKHLVHLLESCLSAEGVQIFIGEESGYAPLNPYAVIGTHYGQRGKSVGLLGVIGPQRLPYDKIIPVVDVTAKCLSAALNSSMTPPYVSDD